MKRKKYRVVHKYGFGKYINGIWTAYVPVKRKKVRKVAMKKKPRKEVCVCSHTKLQHHDCVYTGPEKCPSYCYGCPCQKFRPKRRKK